MEIAGWLICYRLPSKDGLLDWDCAESLNIPDMEKALSHIRLQGTFPVSNQESARYTHRSNHGMATASLPSVSVKQQSASCLPETSSLPAQPFVDSKEDQNSVGPCPASEEKIAALKAKVQTWLQPGQPGHDIFNSGPSLRICVLDGFLLYSPPKFNQVMSLIDLKFFLQVSRAKATHRREARDGYVTLEGFWKDPPGYVDKIVWPNYVEAHKWMFADGDVESGKLNWDVLQEKGILAQQSTEGEARTDFDFEETLGWIVEEAMKALEEWAAREKQEK